MEKILPILAITPAATGAWLGAPLLVLAISLLVTVPVTVWALYIPVSKEYRPTQKEERDAWQSILLKR